jgi:hypothetical protein
MDRSIIGKTVTLCLPELHDRLTRAEQIARAAEAWAAAQVRRRETGMHRNMDILPRNRSKGVRG